MRRLIGSILITIGCYILFINICIWLDIMQIGALVDPLGNSMWYFEKYYFGVQSFTNWIQDFPLSIVQYNALSSIIRLGTSLLAINVVDTGIGVLQVILGLLLGPMTFVWQVILETIQLTEQVILPLFTHITKLLSGMYNLPVGAYPELYYPSISITPVIL